jgi:hypothetical protein
MIERPLRRVVTAGFVVAFLLQGNALMANETANEMLQITVSPPRQLSTIGHQNSSSLLISRTGVVCAFYPDSDGNMVWRTSHDAGQTWDDNTTPFPDGMLAINACGTYLREGGVIRNVNYCLRTRGQMPLAATMIRFNDDFSDYEIDVVPVHFPPVRLQALEPSPHTWAGPIFDKGKMLQLPNGDVLAPMWGALADDQGARVFLSRSSDGGRSWHYDSTVAYVTGDLSPQLPGEGSGASEASIELLADGRMVCVFRHQSSHLPPDYKPLYICWSDDLGKTWTDPQPTNPRLLNIYPTLQVLDNGVLACVYGRPGFHVAFSTDNGHTWSNRHSFSHHPVQNVTGMVDMIKVGPNKLLVIGANPEDKTCVWTVTVDRVADPNPSPFTFTGNVIDAAGNPIANAAVQLGPNRYETDYQPITSHPDSPVATTDEHGRFTFADLSRGEHMLTVEAPGYAPTLHHVALAPDTPPLTLIMQPGAVISGSVIDADDQPVVGACVIIDNTTDLNIYSDLPGHVHSDKRGRFHWVGPAQPDDTYRVRLVKQGYVHVDRFVATARLDQPLRMQRITARPADVPTVPVIRLYEQPTLQDGLDASVWDRAPVVENLKSTNDAIDTIKARFGHDDKNLYYVLNVQPVDSQTPCDSELVEIDFPLGASLWGDTFQFAYTPRGRVPGKFAWNTPGAPGNAWKNDDGSWTVAGSVSWLQLAVPSHDKGFTIPFTLTHAPIATDDPSSLPVRVRCGQLVLE